MFAIELPSGGCASIAGSDIAGVPSKVTRVLKKQKQRNASGSAAS
ncbi:hypothetical protein HaLaN_32313, partial [Haematococcus lacustris]